MDTPHIRLLLSTFLGLATVFYASFGVQILAPIGDILKLFAAILA